MPFSTFYLPSSFCSHFLLSSILLFFSSQLSHWISKSRCHQTKISHSCRDWQIIALRLLCPFSPHLFNVSSFFSTFFSPLLFLCLPFSPHFHFSSFFSTPLPFSLPSFLFLLFSTSFPHIPHFSWKKVQTISISPICVSPFQHRPPRLICGQICIISLTLFAQRGFLKAFKTRHVLLSQSLNSSIFYGLCRHTWKLWKQPSKNLKKRFVRNI